MRSRLTKTSLFADILRVHKRRGYHKAWATLSADGTRLDFIVVPASLGLTVLDAGDSPGKPIVLTLDTDRCCENLSRVSEVAEISVFTDPVGGWWDSCTTFSGGACVSTLEACDANPEVEDSPESEVCVQLGISASVLGDVLDCVGDSASVQEVRRALCGIQFLCEDSLSDPPDLRFSATDARELARVVRESRLVRQGPNPGKIGPCLLGVSAFPLVRGLLRGEKGEVEIEFRGPAGKDNPTCLRFRDSLGNAVDHVFEETLPSCEQAIPPDFVHEIPFPSGWRKTLGALVGECRKLLAQVPRKDGIRDRQDRNYPCLHFTGEHAILMLGGPWGAWEKNPERVLQRVDFHLDGWPESEQLSLASDMFLRVLDFGDDRAHLALNHDSSPFAVFFGEGKSTMLLGMPLRRDTPKGK